MSLNNQPYNWNGGGRMPTTYYDPSVGTTAQNNQVNYAPPQQIQQGYSSLRPRRQPSVMPGRMVNDISDIAPDEVPMDGSIALFLQADLSCIYAKAWNSNGTIDTVRFIPDSPATAEQQKTFEDEVREKLSNIEKKLAEQKSYKRPYDPNYKKNRKPAKEPEET